MAKLIGRGSLAIHSCSVILDAPAPVSEIPALMALPEDYADSIIAVRGSRIVADEDLIYDNDSITVFIAAMGG